MSTFQNPVVTGMNPDPSLCAVGDEFFLVTSSFAYWPGIPVHRSRDLVHWEQIGHVLDRPEQIDLSGIDTSDGIWAPTIRHHDGIFYVVSTVARDRRGGVNFVTTALDAAGPWMQPVVLDAEGIDPSLFFDDDGRCWFTACRDAEDPFLRGPAELYIQELDLETLQLTGPLHVLWNGAVAGAWAEAPHIYKRDGVYYLIAAEGGTERNHSVTAARSATVTGPYRTDPRSPLLTHRHLGPEAVFQNVGHADIVETPAGETWALVLATRPLDGAHTLGREVFLVPANGPTTACCWHPASAMSERWSVPRSACSATPPLPTPLLSSESSSRVQDFRPGGEACGVLFAGKSRLRCRSVPEGVVRRSLGPRHALVPGA